jgi:glutathione synthase/RimK-type ligase-like ATP-grasp enzyme
MIAIHIKESSFSNRWVGYCNEHKIEFVKVNIFDSDLLAFLRKQNVTVLLANIGEDDSRANMMLRAILYSVEKAGIKVFPDNNTFWHFNDKISQKYLFEALDIPHAPMHVFYDMTVASIWLSEQEFPLVFKLSCGAGSSNVFLLRSLNEATQYLEKMFSVGMKPIRSAFHDLKAKMRIHSTKRNWAITIKRLPSTFAGIINLRSSIPNERNYFLVQDFLPGNAFDTRVTIIGDKAFAFRRFNRNNDFKASGSGNIDYTPEAIDKRAILLAFQTAGKISSQSMAFDILFNKEDNPVIIEMSYSYVAEAIYLSGGYWDSHLNYHNLPLRPEDAILEHLFKSMEL